MPGGYPTDGYENPYKAHNLDPRVDGLSNRPKDNSSTAGIGMATTAAGVATSGGADRSRETTAPAPSSLPSTTNPADRSSDLSRPDNTRVPEPGVAASRTGADSTQKPGMMGKMLGAVGLGSLAGGAAASQARSGDDSAVTDTPEQPTTTTGISSYNAPTESTPPQHYRKESIPTTAYPGGDRSPSAIAPPVGGTQAPASEQPRESHTGRDAAIGGIATGGVAGTAAAIGHHDQQDDVRATPESAPYQPQPSTYSSAAPTTAAPVGSQTQSSAGKGSLTYDAVTAPSEVETSRPVAAEPIAAEQDHTGRNAALAGATGVGAAGAGAYGVHEVEQHKAREEAAKQQAAQEKELARQRSEQAKEAEKHQKAVEKEELKQQKEVEKEQKQHEKEVEKEQKEHQKAVAAAEKEQQKHDDEERKRHEKQAAVGAGVGVGAGAAAYEGEKHHEREAEKKPSLFKRLFKRSRKNKHTGEDEEYESENEDDSHKAPVSAGVGATSAGGATATALQNDPTHEPTKYEEVSGGAVKPSYNPFKHDDPKSAGQTTSMNPATAAVAGEHGRTGEPIPHSSAADDTALHGHSSTTPAATGTAVQTGGLAQDSTPRDHVTHEDVTSHGHHGHHTATPTTTTGSAQSRGLTHDNRPHESITGMPYDPSKDPAAAERLQSQEHGSGVTGHNKDAVAGEQRLEQEGQHKESIGEKLKHGLGFGNKSPEAHQENQ